MAIQFFHELVSSPRLFRKKASWGYYLLVFHSSGEPAPLPRVSDFCVPGGSRTDFVVGRTTSCEEGANALISAPIHHESSMGYFCS